MATRKKYKRPVADLYWIDAEALLDAGGTASAGGQPEHDQGGEIDREAKACSSDFFYADLAFEQEEEVEQENFGILGCPLDSPW